MAWEGTGKRPHLQIACRKADREGGPVHSHLGYIFALGCDSRPCGAGPQAELYLLHLPSTLPYSAPPSGAGTPQPRGSESTEQPGPPVLSTHTRGHGSPGGPRLQAAGGRRGPGLQPESCEVPGPGL